MGEGYGSGIPHTQLVLDQHIADSQFSNPQTTWGSRDGADDYDAERMKKRTDLDRMKRPYYPNFITQ